jgi:hypothetical protein
VNNGGLVGREPPRPEDPLNKGFGHRNQYAQDPTQRICHAAQPPLKGLFITMFVAKNHRRGEMRRVAVHPGHYFYAKFCDAPPSTAQGLLISRNRSPLCLRPVQLDVLIA